MNVTNTALARDTTEPIKVSATQANNWENDDDEQQTMW